MARNQYPPADASANILTNTSTDSSADPCAVFGPQCLAERRTQCFAERRTHHLTGPQRAPLGGAVVRADVGPNTGSLCMH